MLAVAPSREAVLIDAGNNARDAKRVLRVVREAGLDRIDYLVVTHYHSDHYGEVPELTARLPIRQFIDHGEDAESGRSPEWHRHWEIGFDTAAGRWCANRLGWRISGSCTTRPAAVPRTICPRRYAAAKRVSTSCADPLQRNLTL